MLNIADQLQAAIAAENAPEGYIFTDVSKALETWDEQGGHFLWLRNGKESVYFVALDDTPITSFVEVAVTEILPMGESYDTHPSAKLTLNLDAFRAVMEGN